MNAHLLQHYLRGAGTVVDLLPVRDAKFTGLRHLTAADALAQDWAAVGSALKKVLEQELDGRAAKK